MNLTIMECYDSAVDEPSIDIPISYVYEYLAVQSLVIPFFISSLL